MNSLIKKQPNFELVFTRYLYAKDEVLLSMITSMLTKELDETLFWFGEWVSSVSVKKSIQEIFKIYYDFYSIKNPKIEKYIEKKILQIKKDDEITEKYKQLANIVKNLVLLDSCSNVFLLRQYMKNDPFPNVIYKGRKPKWCKNFNKEYINLLLSINKRHWYNVCFFLNTIHYTTQESGVGQEPSRDIIDDLHNVIITYFQSVEDISINMEFVFKKWASISYKDKKHLLLAIIVYLTMPQQEIDIDKKMFVSITKKEEEIILNPELCIVDRNLKPYEVLKFGRLYSINKTISCFELARTNITKEYKQLFNHHWEYFAFKSDIWKKRMESYSIVRNKQKLTISFQDDKNDNNYEKFYEKYGYEPDEQFMITQLKSVLDLPVLEHHIWIENCFPDSETIIDISKFKTLDKTDNFNFVW